MASVMRNIMILFFILSSLYEECRSVRFKVLSISSVSVTLGVDVVIPCCLTPEMDATGMEIRWFKTRFQSYVHLYHNGKDDYTAQRPKFTNRTELLKENITRGVFPLKIHKVTAQDSGEYYCFVESSDHHGRAKVQLQVTGRRLPKTSRDTHSHFHVISASIILILSGCVCLFLMRLVN